ncbi:MAG: hydantoinase/oxoprolinase family protein [Gammaproteobacteria bacterium]|nr:hydantoinase/oxoprolinase family protein [Gammaproteobacteria bacterium]
MAQTEQRVLLGIDTGGTFTDFVLQVDGQLRIHKVLSTPTKPEQAILQGIRELNLEGRTGIDFYIVHGSTVATNAVLEGKGVKTVFITNRGLKDMLTIGRQARAELYNLQPEPVPPPVPDELCLETGGRLSAKGEVVEGFTEEDLSTLGKQVAELAPQAVAINLLFSYLDDSFEKQIAAVMPEGCFVSRSSKVLPEYKEYERGMTTWLNSYVGPLVEGYLARLCAGVPEATVSVMQSSGGTIAAEQAGHEAVHMLLSGPAGGLAAAHAIGQSIGRERLLTFDMGGTSTDVALIDGGITLTSEGHIGRYPVAVPMVDMHTIGAGGGSIAWIDSGGLLQVGPQSAGADPGPACYGQGGTQPTVTDANLVLGRLQAGAFLGGGMQLDVAAARTAVDSVGRSLGLSTDQTAEGIIRIANEHMAQALRVMSIQRGIDPRELSLVSFGGAGGLHVCALAEALGMTQALVPIHAGVLSALGMLVAPRARQLSRTINRLCRDMTDSEIEAVISELAEQGMSVLLAEGVAEESMEVQPSLDLRYDGQSYTLNVEWQDIQSASQAFHVLHHARYGHDLDLPVELVNVRVALQSPVDSIQLAHVRGESSDIEEILMAGNDKPVTMYQRASLKVGQQIQGPALIAETVATTYIADRWQCKLLPEGHLVLELG